jgi:hypothetical protein
MLSVVRGSESLRGKHRNSHRSQPSTKTGFELSSNKNIRPTQSSVSMALITSLARSFTIDAHDESSAEKSKGLTTRVVHVIALCFCTLAVWFVILVRRNRKQTLPKNDKKWETLWQWLETRTILRLCFFRSQARDNALAFVTTLPALRATRECKWWTRMIGGYEPISIYSQDTPAYTGIRSDCYFSPSLAIIRALPFIDAAKLNAFSSSGSL